MYVCICAAVTDRQIKQAVREGASTIDDLALQLGVGAGCGCCRAAVQQFLAVEADEPVLRPPLHAREIARVAAHQRPV
jgi:bacterioferritin-associated ferredoxin